MNGADGSAEIPTGVGEQSSGGTPQSSENNQGRFARAREVLERFLPKRKPSSDPVVDLVRHEEKDQTELARVRDELSGESVEAAQTTGLSEPADNRTEVKPKTELSDAIHKGGRFPPPPDSRHAYDWGLREKAAQRYYGEEITSLPSVDLGDGYPITIYHGSPNPNLTEFTHNGGEAIRHGGRGVYFTADFRRIEPNDVSDTYTVYTGHWLGDQPPRVLDGDVWPIPSDAASVVHKWAEDQLAAGNFKGFRSADIDWLTGNKGQGSGYIVNGHVHPASLLDYNNKLESAINVAGVRDEKQLDELLSLNQALCHAGYDVVRHHEFPGNPPDYVFLDPSMIEPVAKGHTPLRDARPLTRF